MASLWRKLITCALVGVSAAHTSWSKACNVTQIEGCSATGSIKSVGGIDIYHAYPRKHHHNKHSSKNDTNNSSTAILFITDFYGLPSINNKLLADNLALATVPVIMPDLFSGDAVPMAMREGPALNLTSWRARHPTYEIDKVVEQTIEYMKSSLGVRRIGAVGYCLGGKHVPRFMAAGKGIERGFIAHPANLTAEEIRAVVGPISVAAGELDNLFNKTNRREAEDILQAKNATYQVSLYSGAPHGFAIRPNVSVPVQAYAKQASYNQAVEWFRAWY